MNCTMILAVINGIFGCAPLDSSVWLLLPFALLLLVADETRKLIVRRRLTSHR